MSNMSKRLVPLDDSITSQNEYLTMSYARKDSTNNIDGDKEKLANLPKSTFSSFVSPAERKKLQQQKLDASRKQENDKEEAKTQRKISIIPVCTLEQSSEKNNEDSESGYESPDGNDDDSNQDDNFIRLGSDSSFSDSTSPTSNVSAAAFANDELKIVSENEKQKLDPTSMHYAIHEAPLPLTQLETNKSIKSGVLPLTESTSIPLEPQHRSLPIQAEKFSPEALASIPPMKSYTSTDLKTEDVSLSQHGNVSNSQHDQREKQIMDENASARMTVANILSDVQSFDNQEKLKVQIEQKRKELELQMEKQRQSYESNQLKQQREMELQQQLELELIRQRRLELEQHQRELEFQVEQRKIQEEEENSRLAKLHSIEMQRLRDLERQQQQQQQRQLQQERDMFIQEGRNVQQQVQVTRAIETSNCISGDLGVSAANNSVSNYNAFRPPASSGQPRSSRYDGVDDDELNWRLDSYVSLSDFTIVVQRALPGPLAPDFDVERADHNSINFVLGPNGSPAMDIYHVHKVMLAVGSNRSELLGRRIREAESTFRGWDGSPDGHSSDLNVHQTIMLEGAANAMSIMLDFCYYPERQVDITVKNAVPLVYLSQRYRIRALLTKAEEFVKNNLESTNAVDFLMDAHLYNINDVLSQAIDVTAAHLDERVDFDPIYKLPPELFQRIVLSSCLDCDSELLSLVVYSYCAEHHPEEIDVKYFREVTTTTLMPDLDSKVALMMMKFYLNLMLKENEADDIMEVIRGDNLTTRCINVTSKNWRDEICHPLILHAQWDESSSAHQRNPLPHEPAVLHRSLPSKIQNVLLEKCILEANVATDSDKRDMKSIDEVEGPAHSEHVIQKLRSELEQLKDQQQQTVSEDHRKQLEDFRVTVNELEAKLNKTVAVLESYKQELERFKRVPGIHTFGEVSKLDSTIIDKTNCTYSANPDHHFPNHRRGDQPPTRMPRLTNEFSNLGRENGYIYNDGKGQLLPVFYYDSKDEEG